jgi:hypothetical protein
MAAHVEKPGFAHRPGPKPKPATEAEIIKRFNKAQDRLVLQASDLSLDTIAKMVSRKAIDIAPSFQRRERWAASKQSALVESFLLNVPVPPVYLMEDDYGTYSVIDGKQRIMAISTFISGRLELNDLKTFTQLNGLRFAQLPKPLRNALEVRPYLRVITLLRQSDPDLKYEVFTRLNEGGEPLNPQELRNVAFRGPTNQLIYELAENPFLRLQLKIIGEKSPAYRHMDDAEYVLRFLVLREEWRDFSGDYRLSMDKFMQRNQKASDAGVADLRTRFLRAINGAQAVWGDAAFKRPNPNGWRDQMLAGMYDAQMVALDLADDATIAHASEVRDAVRAGTRDLFESPDFENAVRIGTNTPTRVRHRIQSILNVLRNV